MAHIGHMYGLRVSRQSAPELRATPSRVSDIPFDSGKVQPREGHGLWTIVDGSHFGFIPFDSEGVMSLFRDGPSQLPTA